MDRTLRGLIAGIAASIMMDSWNLIDFYFFHLTKIRFLDWTAVLASWAKPTSSGATVFFLLLHFLWDGFLGILFAHLLVLITSRGIIIKSCLFGMLDWFIFKIIANLFRVPFLSGIQPFPGVLSNVASVILWGITVGFILKKLDKPAPIPKYN